MSLVKIKGRRFAKVLTAKNSSMVTDRKADALFVSSPSTILLKPLPCSGRIHSLGNRMPGSLRSEKNEIGLKNLVGAGLQAIYLSDAFDGRQ